MSKTQKLNHRDLKKKKIFVLDVKICIELFIYTVAPQSDIFNKVSDSY